MASRAASYSFSAPTSGSFTLWNTLQTVSDSASPTTITAAGTVSFGNYGTYYIAQPTALALRNGSPPLFVRTQGNFAYMSPLREQNTVSQALSTMPVASASTVSLASVGPALAPKQSAYAGHPAGAIGGAFKTHRTSPSPSSAPLQHGGGSGDISKEYVSFGPRVSGTVLEIWKPAREHWDDDRRCTVIGAAGMVQMPDCILYLKNAGNMVAGESIKFVGRRGLFVMVRPPPKK